MVEGRPDNTLPGQEQAAGRKRLASLGGARLFERTTVIDSIVEEIKAKIVSGELRDGDTLPSQDEMARELGVSRASLREALNRLGLMGLVESRHGSGTYVRTARPHDLMNSLSALLILDRATAAELLEARFYVESALAQLAAVNRTEADLERLQQLTLRMEHEHYLGIDMFVPLDTQWHLAVAQASRNQVLRKVLEVIWGVLPERIRHIASADQIPQYLAFHRAIYAALVNGNREAARKEAERHVGFLINLNEHAAAPAFGPGDR